MPPRSYLLIGSLLLVAVAVWLAATHMYGIFLAYLLFGAGACVLMTIGPLLVSYGLKAPLWTGLALATPALVFAANRIFGLATTGTPFLHMSSGFRLAFALALTAAAIACVRLIELVSAPNLITRVLYGILALSAGLTFLGIVQYVTGSIWARNDAYLVFLQWVRWPIIAAKYGALAAASVMLVVRRHIEVWVLVPIIGLIAVEGLLKAFPILEFSTGPLAHYRGLWFWLEPVAYFVAGAAVFRMGSVLLSQRRDESKRPGEVAA